MNLEMGNRRGTVRAEEKIKYSTFGERGVSKGDGEILDET